MRYEKKTFVQQYHGIKVTINIYSAATCFMTDAAECCSAGGLQSQHSPGNW